MTQGSRPRTQKKFRGQGQGQPFRGKTLSRPRTGMLEAKDQEHKCSQKKRKYSAHYIYRTINNGIKLFVKCIAKFSSFYKQL